MNINIQFNNNIFLIKTKKYESIYSIINYFIEENKLEYNIKDLFLDFNGKYLDNNLSLEKYNINENNTLNLNIKLKGGDSFISFFKKNPYIVTLALLISLLPLIILPTGFIPSLASFIENIVKVSFNSIGKYLVCILGKKTIFNRIQWLIVILKYTIFFIMIYVIITLPLTLLCITIKGHNIMDNPSSMCSPIKISNFTGLLLTVFFMFFYLYFRLGDIILYFLIGLFKKTYITDTMLNPILSGLLNLYDTSKYIPIYCIPFIGANLKVYFSCLDKKLPVFKSVLSTITELGCKTSFDKKSFTKLLGKTLNGNLKDIKLPKHKNSIEKPKEVEGLCVESSIKCCSPNNFINIADSIKEFILNPEMSSFLKSINVYAIFILVLEALYEYALNNLGIEGRIPKNVNDRVDFFKDILVDKSNKLTKETSGLIKEYLTTFNQNLITDIEKSVDKDLSNNLDKIDIINNNLSELENLMHEYSYKSGTKYIPGPSLCKIILKYLFLNSICNVFQTSKSSMEIIDNMNDIHNITDMIKAGSATGAILTIFYFIALIVLVCMGIFNKY